MPLQCARHGRAVFLSLNDAYFLGSSIRHSQRLRTVFHNAPTDFESLYGVSTGRWLYNDKFQRAARYTPFNVEGLQEVACKAVDAARCVHLNALRIGMNNKVFLMRFNNGKEAVARIPTSLAGNTYLTTASEAATLRYLRDECNLPVPRVLAWSTQPQPNPVGTDFMIMEYVPGVPLLWRWQAISGKQVEDSLIKILTLDTTLPKHAFSQIGSLYFKEDVSPELQNRPLYLDETRNMSEAAQKYRIGPVVDESWWRGKRLQMAAERGPFPDMLSYLTAAAKLQQDFLAGLDDKDIEQGFQYSTKAELPELRNLLERCLLIAPHLIPKNPDYLSPILAHPELVLPNIMVAPTGNATINAFLDWQGAVAAPLVMQTSPASVLRYTADKIEYDSAGKPILPADIDRMPPEDQKRVRIHHKLAMRQYIYIDTITKLDPHRKAIWTTAESYVTVYPYLVKQILRCWADGPFALRNSLINLWHDWEKIRPEGPPCPIDFSEKELEAHQLEAERRDIYGEQTESLKWDTACHGDGWVENVDFEKAKKAVEKVRERWEKCEEASGGPFPFRDGAWAHHLA
ncbi:hypothetical protein BDN72DRAFT_762892 [Pluteus cervinus]|uniref:Uncharacterized protein n=1 Tax=Pluteus cervinus TaxID=181527 RepID=A0ACD3B4P6_9AGAR|nr:hypothetical protein BDN72DRAFT_762892 [Pluteus cervinus]